jgi:MFS family permease
LFVGQAFIYNGVTFDLGTLLHTYYGLASDAVPLFIVIYAIGNYLGPVTLGRLSTPSGRKPMISLSYPGAAAVLGLAGVAVCVACAVLALALVLPARLAALLVGVGLFVAAGMAVRRSTGRDTKPRARWPR